MRSNLSRRYSQYSGRMGSCIEEMNRSGHPNAQMARAFFDQVVSSAVTHALTSPRADGYTFGRIRHMFETLEDIVSLDFAIASDNYRSLPIRNMNGFASLFEWYFDYNSFFEDDILNGNF